MKRIRDKSGFTILELLLAASILGVILFIVGNAMSGTFRSQRRFSSQTKLETNLNEMAQFIAQVGRLSNTCAWNAATVDSQAFLRCTIDFNVPRDSTRLSVVRFRFNEVARQVLYEIAANPVDPATPFEIKNTYDDIVSFIVCDDTSMQLVGTPQGCPLTPTKISVAHAENRTGVTPPGNLQANFVRVPSAPQQTPAQSFFRFQFRSRAEERDAIQGTQTAAEGHSVFIQGSFYVRNNPVFTSTGNSYQWRSTVY